MGGMGMGGGSSSGDSAAGTPENGLSQAEQEGIQKLEGVLSKEALDGQLRAVSQYGLGDYTLSSASYQLIEAAEAREEQVLCTLRYLLPGADGTASRTFTVDAKTGQVEDLWSYLPWDEDQKPSLTQAEAQEKASAFLQSFCPDRSPKLALRRRPLSSRASAPTAPPSWPCIRDPRVRSKAPTPSPSPGRRTGTSSRITSMGWRSLRRTAPSAGSPTPMTTG